MVAAAGTPTESSHILTTQVNLADSHNEIINVGDFTNEGHSVDAPYIFERRKSTEHVNEVDVDSHTASCTVTSITSSETISLNATDESTDKSNKLRDVDNGWHEIDAKASKANVLPVPKNSEVELTRSNLYMSVEPSAVEEISYDPNVHWVNSEFARLVADKKKVTKTTNEMRKELKEIGLGDTVAKSDKHKTIEDIMRDYGLQPSIKFTRSYSTMSGKSPWMSNISTSKFGVTNLSQNNDTLGNGSISSEVDEIPNNGSSVDDYSYLMRRPSKNGSFVNTDYSRDATNIYSDNRHFSRSSSMAFYDFKNNPSSTSTSNAPSMTNIDTVSTSQAAMDTKRMDDRSLNTSMFFQKERERLKRIDSVINKTPKSSYTSIPLPRHNSRDFSDSFTSITRSYASRDTSPLYKSNFTDYKYSDYGGDMKDWGNSSPVRSYLQGQSSNISSMQYSPVSRYSQHFFHRDGYKDRMSISPLVKKHYSRSSSRGRDHTNHATSTSSKAINSTSSGVANIPTAKQSNSALKSTQKPNTSKSVSDGSRGTKQTSSKTKLKSNKVPSTNTKAKSLDEVDKGEFLAKLMKNYSNSCMPATSRTQNYEIGLTNSPSNKDVMQEWQEFEKRLDRITAAKSTAKTKNAKYKPYQQSVVSMETKPKENINRTKSYCGNMPTAWASSSDLRRYLDDESRTLVGSENDLQSNNLHSNRFAREENGLYGEMSFMRENYPTMGNHNSYLASSERMNDNVTKSNDVYSYSLGRNSCWYDSKDLEDDDTYNMDISQEFKNLEKKKTKNTASVVKKSKTTPKKKTLKRK